MAKFKRIFVIQCSHDASPETMGAVCAMVYLFIIVVFIPWPFYKDIVAATSGGGNRDVMKELEEVETGRLLHRFPHNKVHRNPCIEVRVR